MNVRNFNEFPKTTQQHKPHGVGVMHYCRVWNKDDFATNWEFIDHVILPPGSSIGEHTHGQNEEMYIIIKGSGLMSVDGETKPVVAGDMVLNRCNGTHGLKNNSLEDLVMIVIEVPMPKPC